MLEMIELEQAQKLLLGLVNPVQLEETSLANSWGRVLASPVTAAISVPPFARSALDGYALISADTQGDLPVSLKLIGEVPAGRAYAGQVAPGTVVRILTGAPVPKGGDAVVRQEDTELSGGFVQLQKALSAGANIGREGEDFTRGEGLFGAGTPVSPAVAGALASQGYDRIEVFAKPRVALASTGDELVEVGVPLSTGQIYNSNIYSLAALVHSWGGVPLYLGLVKDKVKALAKVINDGLEQADLVVTTGGASVGTYDVTIRAMEEAGVEVLFWRVAMKPGTPVVCGLKGNKLVLGLSGNPAAAMISASLLLGPMVRKLAGFTTYLPKRVNAVSRDDFSRTSGVRRLIRASATLEEDGLAVCFSNLQQPGVLKSMLGTNALVDLKPHQTLLKGQNCNAYLLEEWT